MSKIIKLKNNIMWDIKSISNVPFTYQMEALVDANNALKTGIFNAQLQSTTCSNYPVSSVNGVMLVFESSGSVIQIYIHYQGDTYIRSRWYGAWYSWKSLT